LNSNQKPTKMMMPSMDDEEVFGGPGGGAPRLAAIFGQAAPAGGNTSLTYQGVKASKQKAVPTAQTQKNPEATMALIHATPVQLFK
jgi:hypothetical protein